MIGRLPTLTLGKASLSASSITVDGHPCDLVDVDDFVSFVRSTQAQVVTTLARLFGDQPRELYLDGITLGFREGLSAPEQYTAISNSFSGNEDQAFILIGWCLQAYLKAMCCGLDHDGYADFVPVAYLITQGWRSSFVSKAQGDQYRKHRDWWNALPPMKKITMSLNGEGARPFLNVMAPVYINPWPFADNPEINPFDLNRLRVVTDMYAAKSKLKGFCHGHLLNLPVSNNSDLFKTPDKLNTWMLKVEEKGFDHRYRCQLMKTHDGDTITLRFLGNQNALSMEF